MSPSIEKLATADILARMSEGDSAAEIAAKVEVPLHEVRELMWSGYRSIGCRKGPEAVAKALASGLIEPPYFRMGELEIMPTGTRVAFDPEARQRQSMDAATSKAIALIASGKTISQATAAVGLSDWDMKRRLDAKRVSLGCRSLPQLVAKAICLGLADNPHAAKPAPVDTPTGVPAAMPFDPVAKVAEMIAEMRADAEEEDRRRVAAGLPIVEIKRKRRSPSKTARKPGPKPVASPPPADLLTMLAKGADAEEIGSAYGRCRMTAGRWIGEARALVGADSNHLAVARAITSDLIRPYQACGPAHVLMSGQVTAVDPESGEVLWVTEPQAAALMESAAGSRCDQQTVFRAKEAMQADTKAHAVAKAICLGVIDVGWAGSPGRVLIDDKMRRRPQKGRRKTYQTVENERLAPLVVELFAQEYPHELIAERLSKSVSWVRRMLWLYPKSTARQEVP